MADNNTDWSNDNSEPMTDAQKAYLTTLAQGAGEDPNQYMQLTKAEASQKIKELQQRTGQGLEDDLERREE